MTRAAASGYPVSGSVLTLCLPACEGACEIESHKLAHVALGRGKFGCHFVLVLAFCFHCRYFPSIFFGSIQWEDKPGIVAHTCKSTSGKLSQGDSEFEASLGPTARPGLQNNSFQVHAEYTFSPSVSASNRAQVICTKQVMEVMADQGLVRTPCTEALASQRGF